MSSLNSKNDGSCDKDKDGSYHLYFALNQPRFCIDTIKLVLTTYPDSAKEKDKDGQLPLHYVIKNDAPIDIIKVLLTSYPDSAKEKEKDGQLPLHYASLYYAPIDVIESLLTSYSDGAKEKEKDGQLPLHYAIKNKSSIDIIEALLTSYPDSAKEKDKDGQLPLHFACLYYAPNGTIESLLTSYSDGVKEKNKFGQLPLHYAIKNKPSIDTIELLLTSYPDSAKEKDKDGQLPHHCASKNKASYGVICTLRAKCYSNFFLSLINVIGGRFEEYSKISKIGIVATDNYVSSHQLRVFVSSTFTDTHLERNVILDEIVPILKVVAAPHAIEIIFIDMRYGVRDENTLDHMTWLACKTELKQCLQLSNGNSFLSLLGDKYGYQPIPKYIPQDLYNTRYSLLSANEQKLLDQWYRLDTNNIPTGRYVLKNLMDKDDAVFWSVQSKIREILKDIPFDRDQSCNDVLIDRSVTDYETRYALSSVRDNNRCLWISREFENGVPNVDDFNDTFHNSSNKLKLDNLTMMMHGALSNTMHTKISYDHYIANDDVCKQYLLEFKERVSKYFLDELTLIIDKKLKWQSDAFGLGVKGRVIDEILHHCKIVNDKCDYFIGRGELVTAALDMILSDNSNHDIANVFSISLCCIGNSGTGKTALMSKLASMIRHHRSIRSMVDNTPVIIRFCGTSGDSMNGLNLIKSISRQIEILYELQKEEAFEIRLHAEITSGGIITDEYADAVQYFQALLSQYPVILFIDSLDQLKNDYQASSKISFLHGLRSSLHKDSRIIVSALPDERDKGYFYQCDTILAKAKVPRVTVTSFDSATDESKSIITSILRSKSRSLTDSQMNYVMNQVSIEPTALYIRLAVKVIENWSSFTNTEDLLLQGGVCNLINQLFDSLERDYGKELVQAVLGLVTFSIGGLNVNHIKDLLSLNENVIKSTFQYSKPNKLEIPIHVILRLLQALQGLVVERDDGKIYWYHRQLVEAAVNRYKPIEQNCHLLMAVYFGNLIDSSLRNERLISAQPLVFGKHSPWFKEANVNKTSCIECVSHMLKCNVDTMLAEAYKKLCNLDYICASIKVGEGYNLVLHLRELERLLKQHNSPRNELISVFESHDIEFNDAVIRIYHYIRWLTRNMSAIVTNPSLLLVETATTTQPLVSKARIDMVSLLDKVHKAHGISLQSTYSDDDDISELSYRGRCLGGHHSFDSTLMVLVGHYEDVNSVSFSSDGSKVVSGSGSCGRTGSYDNTIRIWDIFTGTEIHKLDGHSGNVNSVSFNSDDSKIVSGSDDKSVRVWDAITATETHKLDGHSDTVYSVSFSSDDSKIVSGSRDRSVRVWDVSTGMEIHNLDGHSDAVLSVSFSSDDSKIVSGSEDNSIRVWDAVAGAEIHKLSGHTGAVSSVLFSSDGSKIVSGSWDKSVRVWDILTSTEIHKLDGHSDWVRSVSLSSDDSKIVSGSWDKSIRVWDISTGTETHKLVEHRGPVSSVSFSSDDSKIVSGSDDMSVRVWDVFTFTEAHKVDEHTGPVTSVSFSSDDSKIVSGSEDRSIRIWDVGTGIETHKLSGHSGAVSSVSLSSDDSKIVSGSDDRSIRIWDVGTGIETHKLYGHSGPVYSVSLSSDDSKIVSGSDDKSVRVWDISTGTETHKLSGHSGAVYSVSLSSDDSMIVSGSRDRSVRVWNVSTGMEIHKLYGHSDAVLSVSFSSDDSKIVSGSRDRSIRVWDAVAGAEIHKLSGHSGAVSSVSFSSNGSKIVSGSDDKSVRVWNVSTGTETHKLYGHRGHVSSVSLSSDDSKIVSGSDHRSIRIWSLSAATDS